jgi:hypothetical protein
MDLKKTCCEDIGLNKVAHDHVQWWALVLVVLNLLVTMNSGGSSGLNRRTNDRVPITPVLLWLSLPQRESMNMFHMASN